jgi:predicted RNA binding protein YcfA (HicA-like mRNA interferase family)
MNRPPRVTAEQVVRALRRAGFIEVAAVGGHRQFKRPEGGGRVTVPVHAGRTLFPRTLRSILRQAGLTVEEFQNLL